MSDIRSGDIVECIDDTPHLSASQIMPVQGQLYSVTSVRPVGDGLSVRLKELLPSCWQGGVCACGDCGWGEHRFRKILRPNGEFLESLLKDIDLGVETPERVG